MMLSFIIILVILMIFILYKFIYETPETYNKNTLYHVLIVPFDTNFKPMISQRPLIILNQSDFTYNQKAEDDVFVFEIKDKKLKNEKDYELLVKNILGENNKYKLYLDI